MGEPISPVRRSSSCSALFSDSPASAVWVIASRRSLTSAANSCRATPALPNCAMLAVLSKAVLLSPSSACPTCACRVTGS